MTNLRSSKGLTQRGAAIASDEVGQVALVLDSSGNAQAITLTADGKVPVDAGTVAGGATEAKQDATIAGLVSIDNHVDGLEAGVGAPGDAVAASDVATGSLISLLRRLLQYASGAIVNSKNTRGITTVQLDPATGDPVSIQALGQTVKASSVGVTLASDDDLVAVVGAKTDAKAAQTDATSLSLMQVFKQISASIQAAASSLTGLVAVFVPTAELGKTNIRHFIVTATGAGILTREANMTAYTASDSISNSATAGSVTAMPVTISDTNGDPINLLEILLDCDDTGFGAAQLRIHLFNSDPTANSGVVAGDNAAYSQKRAGWLGSFLGTMTAFQDGCACVLIPETGSVKIASVEAAGKRIWWQLQTLSAVTPAKNSSVFTPRFKGYQGRV